VQPRSPDPIAAAKNLQKIPARVRGLSSALEKANEEAKLFPDWREYQLLSFIKYAGLYASDLNETYSAGRVDSLAQAIWTQYCGLSEENAKRFFDDAARDVRDSFETVQKLYTHVNKEPEKKLDAKLSEMKEVAAKYNVENYDAPYTRVNDAARVVGKELAHVPVYKLASKLAHPTARLLCINRPLQDLQDTLYEGGAKLAVMCLGATERCIKTKYPELHF
jgi:hypothetical protein